jgi:hypothetical protein
MKEMATGDADQNDTIDDDIHVLPLDLKTAIDGVKLKFRLVTPEYTLTPDVEPNERGIATLFRSPLECLQVCGGLSESFVVRVQAESNDYYHMKIKPGLGKNRLFHGIKWENIWIILRISMKEKDRGGYKAYFAKHNKVVHIPVLAQDMSNGRFPRKLGMGLGLGGTCRFAASNKFGRRFIQKMQPRDSEELNAVRKDRDKKDE